MQRAAPWMKPAPSEDVERHRPAAVRRRLRLAVVTSAPAAALLGARQQGSSPWAAPGALARAKSRTAPWRRACPRRRDGGKASSRRPRSPAAYAPGPAAAVARRRRPSERKRRDHYGAAALGRRPPRSTTGPVCSAEPGDGSEAASSRSARAQHRRRRGRRASTGEQASTLARTPARAQRVQERVAPPAGLGRSVQPAERRAQPRAPAAASGERSHAPQLAQQQISLRQRARRGSVPGRRAPSKDFSALSHDGEGRPLLAGDQEVEGIREDHRQGTQAPSNAPRRARTRGWRGAVGRRRGAPASAQRRLVTWASGQMLRSSCGPRPRGLRGGGAGLPAASRAAARLPRRVIAERGHVAHQRRRGCLARAPAAQGGLERCAPLPLR